ncbi:hypothetical protein CVT24_005872 [Panaeolus cyanescens]|uniref:Uncharacterized protein n=1 Tax=Panaeolus cyanescens TaxID=181874 RepID=A0A409YF16_9AGAR|nr:hypothetical protein CVT24_005872 [Panaeolus cyanescens]
MVDSVASLTRLAPNGYPMAPRRKSTSKSKRHNSRAFHDPAYEERIQQAIDAKYGDGPEKDWTWSQLSKFYSVAYQTLRDRASGRHRAMSEAGKERRLLNGAQESAMLSWAEQNAAAAVPWDIRDMRAHANPAIPSDAESEADDESANDNGSQPPVTILNAELGSDTEEESNADPDFDPNSAEEPSMSQSATLPTLPDFDWEGSDCEDNPTLSRRDTENMSWNPTLPSNSSEFNFPDEPSLPQRRRTTRFSTPSETLNPTDLIAHCYREMAKMQYTPDESKLEDELIEEIQALRKQINSLAEALEMQCALTDAANAHCTIAQREISHLRTKLENSTKPVNRGPTKVKARFLTLPAMREAFEAEEKERLEKERMAEEKELQRRAEDEEKENQIKADAASKVFSDPLSSYKKKHDLRALALALGLSDLGTVPILLENIRQALDEKKNELQQNPRFSGLFSSKRRRIEASVNPEASTQEDPDLVPRNNDLVDNSQSHFPHIPLNLSSSQTSLQHHPPPIFHPNLQASSLTSASRMSLQSQYSQIQPGHGLYYHPSPYLNPNPAPLHPTHVSQHSNLSMSYNTYQYPPPRVPGEAPFNSNS